MNIGTLTKIDSTKTLFWIDKAGEDNSCPLPDFAGALYPEDLFPENEKPLAMILGADFTDTYIRVLWGDRIGWVAADSISDVNSF